MDRTTFRHRLAVSFLDELRLDVFVRSDHGNVEHYWTDDTDISIFGPEDLGGSFDTDPVAVGNHLIGRSGNRIVDWVWDAHGEPRMLGAPREVVLPGLCASTPEVIGTSGRIDVFAPSLDGPMRHWFRFSGEGWQGPEVLTDDLADVFSQPCAVSRAPGTFDVFSVGAPNQGLLHWFNDAQGWHCERRTRGAAGEGLAGQPAAVWSTDQRLDVFAMRSDGIPMHWGFDGRDWFPDEVKLGDARLDLPVDLTLISIKPRQLTLLARESGGRGDGELRAWSLDPRPPGRWHSSGLEGNLRPTAVWARNSAVQVPPDGAMEERGLMTTLSRDVDRNTRDESDLDSGGGFLRVQHVLTDQHSIDGTEIWETDTASTLALEEPAPPATPLTPADVQPDLLARRPEDLVLLGVRWNEQVEVLAGSPTELLAHAGAKLTVTLPPQHYAEGVVDAAAPSVTGMPGGDVRVSPVRASGPSRVVVSLDEGTRVPLTVDGVLDALRRGRLIPSTKLTDEDTQLELPYRLLVTPFRPDGQPIRLDHPSRPVVGGSGAVALWSTTVAAEGSEPAAGLTLRPLGVDSSDPFRTSLSGASRSRIMAAEPTASIDLLRLSSLGGWLTASGRWESFEWDHEAALGRDVRVRTATMGVLYPWGHRAVYVETSERHLASSAAGATAHLRKRSFLTVTEPVHDLAPSRAFPFTRARVQETVFDFATEPTWTKKPFPPPAADEVRQTRAFLVSVADGLRATIHGGDGFTPGEPVAEDLAFFGGLTDEATAQAAGRYVDAGVAIMRADDTLAALEFGGTAPVPIFFVPGGEATARKVPTVLSGPSGEVAVELPVVFFADVRMPAGLTHPAYRSFDDPVMLEEVDAAWRRTGDGDVAITPVSIDMVGAVVRQPADSPEVRRLHIVGEAMNGGFAPRLGATPAKPAAERWAFEMAMTEVATLVGQPVSSGPPVLRVSLSEELLSGTPDPGLLFVATDPSKPLTAEFSRNSARSGGLAAPDLTIDGISRTQGPVNADTFLAQVQGRHDLVDPTKFLGEGASLLGFNLARLIDVSRLTQTPRILSDARPGQPPTVTMLWEDVRLRAPAPRQGARDVPPPDDEESDVVVTSDATSLTVNVTLAPGLQTVVCTVRDIALVFPGKGDDRLLEVHFGEVSFTQSGGATPQLRVDRVTTKFFGFLKLLQDLQEVVKLEGAAIEVSDRGVTATYDLPIPDVTTGGFQLTGLTFHSMIDVPFDQRPVSIELAFASREDPFNVSILGLGGGGYIDIALDKTGLKRLEFSLEFGASLEVDFFVASGEVYAMGGIRVVKDNGFQIGGYLRFGGMVEVLGLVSVSVELLVTLTYIEESVDPPLQNAMIGRATLVLEIDLLLFSESVELDTGPWVIAGGTPVMDTTSEPVGLDAEAWLSYRSAFDEEALA